MAGQQHSMVVFHSRFGSVGKKGIGSYKGHRLG